MEQIFKIDVEGYVIEQKLLENLLRAYFYKELYQENFRLDMGEPLPPRITVKELK